MIIYRISCSTNVTNSQHLKYCSYDLLILTDKESAYQYAIELQNRIFKNDINFVDEYHNNKDFIGYRDSSKTHYERYLLHQDNLDEYLYCCLKKFHLIRVKELLVNNYSFDEIDMNKEFDKIR